MHKLGLIDRVLLGRGFTLAMNAVTLVILAVITVRDVLVWVALTKDLANPTSRGLSLHDAFSQQTTVGVILVALGVVLEGRHTFVLRVKKVYQAEHLPGQEEFCDLCELYGFYLLVMGLAVECFDEFMKFFDLHHPFALFGFCGGSVVLNAISMVFLVQLSLKILPLRLEAV
ncbi:MAG: hypothetical protein K1Y36_25090 [Blastocatellia bacterium]|nr:hypothetical protein [Blastocatellia bacterium]